MANTTITLRNDQGQQIDFDILGYVDYKGKEYVVLYPIEEDDGEVLILEVDGENNFLGLNDDNLIEEIFTVFKEEFKDEYVFDGDEDAEDYTIEIDESDPDIN